MCDATHIDLVSHQKPVQEELKCLYITMLSQSLTDIIIKSIIIIIIVITFINKIMKQAVV